MFVFLYDYVLILQFIFNFELGKGKFSETYDVCFKNTPIYQLIKNLSVYSRLLSTISVLISTVRKPAKEQNYIKFHKNFLDLPAVTS